MDRDAVDRGKSLLKKFKKKQTASAEDPSRVEEPMTPEGRTSGPDALPSRVDEIVKTQHTTNDNAIQATAIDTAQTSVAVPIIPQTTAASTGRSVVVAPKSSASLGAAPTPSLPNSLPHSSSPTGDYRNHSTTVLVTSPATQAPSVFPSISGVRVGAHSPAIPETASQTSSSSMDSLRLLTAQMSNLAHEGVADDSSYHTMLAALSNKSREVVDLTLALKRQHTEATKLHAEVSRLQSETAHLRKQNLDLMASRDQSKLIYENQLAALSIQLKNYSDSSAILLSDKDVLQKSIVQLEAAAAARTAELTTAKRLAESQRVRILELEQAKGEHGVLAKSVAELRDNINIEKHNAALLSSERDELKAENTELRVLCQGHVDTIAELRARLLKQQTESHSSDRSAITVSLENQLRSVTSQLHIVESTNETIKAEKDLLFSKMSKLQAELDDREQVVTELQVSNEQCQQHIRELTASNAGVQSQLAACQRDSQDALAKLSNELSELSTIRASSTQNDNALKEKDQEIIDLRNKLHEVEKSMAGFNALVDKTKGDQETISRALSQNKELKRQIEEIESRFIRLTNDNMQLTTDTQALTHQKVELLRTIERIKEEQLVKTQSDGVIIEALQAKVLAVDDGKLDASKAQELRDTLAAQQHALESLKDGMRTLTTENSRIEQENSALRAQIDLVRNEHKEELKTLVRHHQQQTTLLQSQLQQRDAELVRIKLHHIESPSTVQVDHASDHRDESNGEPVEHIPSLSKASKSTNGARSLANLTSTELLSEIEQMQLDQASAAEEIEAQQALINNLQAQLQNAKRTMESIGPSTTHSRQSPTDFSERHTEASEMARERELHDLMEEHKRLKETGTKLRIALDEAVRRERDLIHAKSSNLSTPQTLTTQQLEAEREKLFQQVTELTEMNHRLRTELAGVYQRLTKPTFEDVAMATEAMQSMAEKPFAQSLPVGPDGHAPDGNAIVLVTIARLKKENNRLLDQIDVMDAKIIDLTSAKVELMTKLEEEQYLTTQLSSETETIGEYIGLYQSQRQAMTKFVAEKLKIIENLERENKELHDMIKTVQLQFQKERNALRLPAQEESSRGKSAAPPSPRRPLQDISSNSTPPLNTGASPGVEWYEVAFTHTGPASKPFVI